MAGAAPSLTVDQLEAVRWAGVPLIVVNRTRELAPWADWLHGCDAQFWRWYPSARQFPGIKTTCEPQAAVDGVKLLRKTGHEGFDPDPSCVRTGFNGGYQAAIIAVHAGARRVILLGIDGKPGPKGKRHWHHRHPVNSEPPFAEMRRAFRTIAPELKSRGVEVLNCSPGSAIDAFGDPVDLADALAA